MEVFIYTKYGGATRKCYVPKSFNEFPEDIQIIKSPKIKKGFQNIDI